MKTETQQLIDALLIRFNARAEKWNMLSIETTTEPKLTYALTRKREAQSALGVLQDEVSKLVKQIEKDNATPAATCGVFPSPFADFPKRDIQAGDPFFAPALEYYLKVDCSQYELVMQGGGSITDVKPNDAGMFDKEHYPFLVISVETGPKGWAYTQDGFYSIMKDIDRRNLVLKYRKVPAQASLVALDFVKIANDILAGTPGYDLKDGFGRSVRIVSTAGHSDYPLIGYIADDKLPTTYTKNGTISLRGTESGDLVATPLPPKILGYINVYKNRNTVFHTDRKSADTHADSSRVACIEVKEGDGL